MGLDFGTQVAPFVAELLRDALHPRGNVLLVPQTQTGLFYQMAMVLVTGNGLVIDRTTNLGVNLDGLPESVARRLSWSENWAADSPFSAALVEGDTEQAKAAIQAITALPGPLVLVQVASSQEIASDLNAYNPNWLLEEVTISVNTAAAGGNASLMSIG